MKKIWFVLSVLAMMVVVGCSNPAATVEEDVVQTLVEDKSPYEYVKPACVNLADYTYVGDYIFADTMNFAEWKYSNSETEYRLAFEKIARVKNDNPDTQISRCSHDTGVDSPVVKATKYKIYIKTSVVNNTEENQFVLNVANKGLGENYDGSNIRIKKLSGNELQLTVAGDGNISDYVAY